MRGHHLPLDYHASLLGDPVRVDAYHRAIRRLVQPGDVVLDIGTGSGLLAMLAARAGAARVHAVESASVARVARALVAANGLADVVIVHSADLVDMEPVEPVDLVIGEWMGRFVVDDYMLDAVATSGAWLKPGGRCCPAEVALSLGLGSRPIPGVQRWMTPLRGLDLTPALNLALHTAYPGALAPAELLGPGVVAHTLRPPDIADWPDLDAVLEVVEEGVLHALVGWWEALLAPGVALSTQPGSPTHWGQYQWPVPPTRVEPGDQVAVKVWMEPERRWHWRVTVVRGRETLLEHSAHTEQWGADPGLPLPPATDAVSLSAASTRAFNAHDLPNAVVLAAAATRAGTPVQQGVLYENLGLAFVNVGRLTDAVDAFLAAQHDGPREQALRFLVACGLRLSWLDSAAEWQATYESNFGPWTDPWAEAATQT